MTRIDQSVVHGSPRARGSIAALDWLRQRSALAVGPHFDPALTLQEIEAHPGEATNACRAHATTLRVTTMRGRVGMSARARARLGKRLKAALVARGRVRVPIAQARWLLATAAGNLKGSFADLARDIPNVNVTIELFRVLRPSLVRAPAELGENFAQFVALRHLEKLPGCPYFEMQFGPPDHPRLGRLATEANLGLSLAPIFDAARFERVPTAQRGMFALVVYASLPEALGQHLEFRPTHQVSTSSPVVPLPAGLKADRLAGATYRVPSRNVRSFLATPPSGSPSWVGRIAVDSNAFEAVFRSARVRVELLRLEKGGWPPSLHEVFGGYVNRNLPANSAAITAVFDPGASGALEKQLQISLTSLMAALSASDPRQHKLLVSVWFPNDDRFKRVVVAQEDPILDRFAVDRSFLTTRHRKRLRIIARHIDATWQRSRWQSYQPVHHVVIEGHTDRSGSEGHNDRLGRARADAVATELRRNLRALNGGHQGSLVDRVRIEVKSLGETEPDASTTESEKNRRVQLFLNTATPRRALKEAAAAALGALPGHPGLSTGERTIIGCLLRQMTKLDLDDRYVGTQAIREPLRPQLYPRLRDGFLRAAYMPFVPRAGTATLEIWDQSTSDMIGFLQGTAGTIQSAIVLSNRLLTNPGAQRLFPTIVWLFRRVQGAEPSMLKCFD